jgi:hypothetical protein
MGCFVSDDAMESAMREHWVFPWYYKKDSVFLKKSKGKRMQELRNMPHDC